jgi:hypothetical protein
MRSFFTYPETLIDSICQILLDGSQWGELMQQSLNEIGPQPWLGSRDHSISGAN